MQHLASIGFAVLLAASGVVEAWAHGGGGMGGITEGDICAREKGHYLVHFSAYQHREPTASLVAQLKDLKDADLKRYLDVMKEEFQSYCKDLPRTGKATLTFDLISDELRKIPVAVRVVEAAESGDSATVLNIPKQVYPSGVVRAETDFAKAGRYTAIVEVQEHPGRSHPGDAAQGVVGSSSHGGVEAVSLKHVSEAEEEAYHAHDSTFSFPFTVGLKAARGSAPAIVKNPAIVMMIIAGMAIGAVLYVRRKKQATS